jgi:hypothetical protein
MSAQGFYGDTFSDGFGGFQTMRTRQQEPSDVFDYPQKFIQGVRMDKVISFSSYSSQYSTKLLINSTNGMCLYLAKTAGRP